MDNLLLVTKVILIVGALLALLDAENNRAKKKTDYAIYDLLLIIIQVLLFYGLCW